MAGKYVLLFLLLSCCLISCKKVIVDYDEHTDVILKDGKLYIPTIKEVYESNSTYSLRVMNLDEGYLPSNIEGTASEHCGEELVTGSEFWFYIFIVLFLTIFAGLMSGLTVGYLSIDDLVLELRSTSGTDEEKEYASKVLPILSNRHWLLVTLLLMNAFAMEALPIFLDKIVPEYLAIVISVSLVLLFGEVIPQAICTGPDQVKIAAYVAPLTRFLMVISSPISYPIAKLLDRLLGEHHKSRFLNNDLKALIELHTFNQLKKLNHDDEEVERKSTAKMGLDDEQANLMISALEMREKKVIELMIPIKNTFMIDYDEVLDKFKLQLILDKGYSRIPVYSNHNPNDIEGLLRIKNLIGVDFKQNKTLRQLGIDLKKPLVISPRLSLIDLLRQFREGRSHMAFITEQVEELQEKYGIGKHKLNPLARNKDNIGFKKDHIELREKHYPIKILGIITLEDVIEKMINLDILDEDDFDKLNKKRDHYGHGQAFPSSINNRAYSKEIARSLIREEGLRLDALIKESYSKRKSIKELFLKKGDSNQNSYAGNKFLKDPLV